jgi:hypothetical protein
VLYAGVKLGLAHYGRNSLRVLANSVLRKMFGLDREEVTGGLQKCIVRNCTICISDQILLGRTSQEGRDDGACDTYVGEEKCIDNFGMET